ncbi:DUF3267 domain-containing protein [Telluribacter sp.]|jgi:hypothetical protein|uniref:DUF3267 domain-containing protein n=1 Tax=Telluribacter sp. TaxID=1978767 RepID=UPI002E1480CB|nr:DUF3267 domain-containing protein [Telluribacter sp.]
MKTRPTIQELHQSPAYELVESFSIDEMSKFIAREINITGRSLPYARTFRSARLVLILLAAIGVGILIGWVAGTMLKTGAGELLLSPVWQIVLALTGFFIVVLPLHEAIHALVFKLLGADKVGFGYSLKSMMVYAYAQRFVMTIRENALVAAMPFILITMLLAGLLLVVPGLKMLWFLLLLLHTLGCVGDFVLIKYAYRNRSRERYTYDDLDEGRTYFFEALTSDLMEKTFTTYLTSDRHTL